MANKCWLSINSQYRKLKLVILYSDNGDALVYGRRVQVICHMPVCKKFLSQAPLPGPFSSASRYFRKKSNKGGSLTTIDIPDVMGYVAYKQY